MEACRPPLFWNRQFEPTVIVTCGRWYPRFSLSLRDLEELMADGGLCGPHHYLTLDTSLWPAVYAREVDRTSATWHIDKTFVRIADRWMYLFRAVDSGGQAF